MFETNKFKLLFNAFPTFFLHQTFCTQNQKENIHWWNCFKKALNDNNMGNAEKNS